MADMSHHPHEQLLPVRLTLHISGESATGLARHGTCDRMDEGFTGQRRLHGEAGENTWRG